MRKKGNFTDSENGMFVGVKQAGLSVSETADLLEFPLTAISMVYRKRPKKEKLTSEWQLCRQKCLVDVRGQMRNSKLV